MANAGREAAEMMERKSCEEGGETDGRCGMMTAEERSTDGDKEGPASEVCERQACEGARLEARCVGSKPEPGSDWEFRGEGAAADQSAARRLCTSSL